MIRCYVTNRRQADLLSCANAAIRDGVDMIQVREKDLATRALYELVCQIRDAAAGTPTKVLVNDRLDVALAAKIDGVHLPANGLPAARVRPLVRLMGCSTHKLDEVVQAERDGADYAIFGPVFETPGKVPVGIEALREAVSSVRIPVLAIGGITRETAKEVEAAGAAGIAAIRLFQGSDQSA